MTWARACFEQGALPSLSVLPGAVEVRSLTGDKMFQATHVIEGYQRPCILHGYGGAKSSMPSSLPDLAQTGWTVLAAALLGTKSKPPLWTQNGFRPVLGTTIDCRISPCPVSYKQESLLLSRRWPAEVLHSHNTFLKGYEPSHSPSQAHTMKGLSPTATAPAAILELLSEVGYPMWTLSPPPDKYAAIVETLVLWCALHLWSKEKARVY